MSDYAVGMSYGDGSSANGTVFYDTVNLSNGYICKNLGMVLIMEAMDFGTYPVDGLLGLGFNTHSFAPAVLDDLKAQGVLQSRNFSLYLSYSGQTNGSDYNSELIIGGYNAKYMLSDDFEWLPLVLNTSWKVGMISFTIANSTFISPSGLVLIDSGTSLMVAPNQEYQAVITTLQQFDSTCKVRSGNPYVGCDCKTDDKIGFYPSLVFTLGSEADSHEVVVSPDYYMYWAKDPGVCYVLLQTDPLVDFWIFGDGFLQMYYTYFDMENLRIGFAPANPSPNFDDSEGV